MFWNKYFRPSVIIMLVVVALHWAASLEGLYWSLRWFDIPMHFLGGLWTLLFLLWVVSTQYASRYKKYITFQNVFLFVLAVGVLWELHELALRFTSFDDSGYWYDTGHDIIMDMLGAAFGVLVYRKEISSKLN
jgi:hypothetical protein